MRLNFQVTYDNPFDTFRILSYISKDFFFLNPSEMAFQESPTIARNINTYLPCPLD